MKKNILNALKYSLLLALGAALFYLAFRGQDAGKIINGIRQANYGWIGLALVLSLVAFISRAYRWNLLVEPLGYKPLLKNSFFALMVGYMANLAIPRIGEVSRCVSLSKTEKIPMDVLLGTVIMERTIDVITLLGLTFLLAVIEFHRLGTFLTTEIFRPLHHAATQLTSSPIILGMLGVVIVSFVFLWITRKNKSEVPVLQKIILFIQGIFRGIRTIFSMKARRAFLAHTVLIWVLYFLTSYLCFFAVDSTSGLGFRAGFFVLIAGGLGMSAPVQGGIGTFHLLVAQGLVLFGLPQAEGLIYATVVHASQFLFILALGGISLLALGLFQSRKEKNAPGT